MGKNRAKTLANIISLILSAPTMAGVISIVFAFTFPKELGPIVTSLQAATIGILTPAFLPVVPIFYYRIKGTVDLNVSEREKRPPSLFLLYYVTLLGQ